MGGQQPTLGDGLIIFYRGGPFLFSQFEHQILSRYVTKGNKKGTTHLLSSQHSSDRRIGVGDTPCPLA